MDGVKYTADQYNTALYLCRLIYFALNDTVLPPALPEGVTLRSLYSIAHQASVEGLTYYAASRIPLSECQNDPEIMEKWKKSLDKTILKQAYFDSEREQILACLSEKGISHIPLKAVNLQKIYPKPGMRSMADNDILFGYVKQSENGGYVVCRSADEDLRSIMTDRGFEIYVESEKDTVYQKKPFYNFEFHRNLFLDKDLFYSYYENPWGKAYHVRDNLYSFSPEDEYIYNTAHLHHHFTLAGCGIRNIADLYVIYTFSPDPLDLTYIDSELEKLGIAEFHNKIREFTYSLFNDDPQLDEEQRDLLMYIISSGTFGTMDRYIDNNFNKVKEKLGSSMGKAKLSYILKRIFPLRSDIKQNYPFFYKYPVFIPVLYIYRIFNGLINRSGEIFGEFIKILKK